MRHAGFATLVISALLLASGLNAQPRGENRLEAPAVEAIDAFHAVMGPLWHDAYPQEDIAAIEESIPSLKAAAERVEQVAEAGGPEDLRDLAGQLVQSVSALEATVAGGESAEVLKALELVHDNLHALMVLSEAKEHPAHDADLE